MKFSYNWLKEYINLKGISPEELAEAINLKSFEVKDLSKVGKDYVLDIDILPNRAHDCLSYIGLAREISVLFNRPLKKVKISSKKGVSLSTKFREVNKKIGQYLTIEVEEPNLCHRYSARFLFDIKVKSSPKWLVERLEHSGLRSVNNVVDVTNYVMLEMGQPLHAFDYDKIFSIRKKKKILIRRARENEEMMSLDNNLLQLNSDILVIADERQSIAVAGIKGGKIPEIDKNTSRIVLESANFDSSSIRQTSKFLKLKTDSSARFEAGIDPNLAEEALNRAAYLLIKLAKAKSAKGFIDFYPKKLLPKRVCLPVKRIKKFLGVGIEENFIEQLFKRLGFKFEKISLRKELLKLAKKLIGRGYKYGASTHFDAPKIFDCSSFTRYLFRSIGIEIPRPSIEQYLFSEKVKKDKLQPGDLVFFVGNKPHKSPLLKEQIGHVAVYIGNNEIIHANSIKKKVVKENLDSVSRKLNFVGGGRILKKEDDSYLFTVPTFRLDIENENDLLEEIIRVYGYDKLPIIYPKVFLKPIEKNEFLEFFEMIRDTFYSNGFSEIYNYSFFGDQEKDFYNVKAKEIIELENPISLKMKYLRTSLLPALIRNIKDNLRFFDSVRIFEIGNIFQKFDKSVLEKKIFSAVLSYKNRKRLSGDIFIKGEEYYELKGILDLVLKGLGFSDYFFDDVKPTEEVSFLNIWHPLRAAEVKINNQEIGFVGEISSSLLEKLDIGTRVSAIELDLEKLFKLFREEKEYQPIIKYPAVVRDISILVPFETKVDNVLNKIENADSLIYDTDLIDIYEGEELSGGKKSLTFKIIYQSPNKTLSDKEVERVHQKLINILEENPEWEVRK